MLGLAYAEYSDAEEAVVHAHSGAPSTSRKRSLHPGLLRCNKHRPDTTFGNVNADVLADNVSSLQASELLQHDPGVPIGAGKPRCPCDRKSKH